MYIYGIQDAAGNVHYVGLTTKTPNLRFNWHVWASRHPKSPFHNVFHVWMAKQDLTTLTCVVLKEVHTLDALRAAEKSQYKKLVRAGHPLKCNKHGLGLGIARLGKPLSAHQLNAMKAGRQNSKIQTCHRHAANIGLLSTSAVAG